MSYEAYAGLLMAFDEFPGHLSGNARLTCDHSDPRLIELKEKYALRKVAGTGQGIGGAVSLLHWLCGHVRHDTDAAAGVPMNALDLLDHAFDGGEARGLHGPGLAVALTECLLAVGYEARTIYARPFSPFDDDVHAVTCVYLWDSRRWAMLDPTFNGYVLDASDAVLSPWEARRALAFQVPVHFNGELGYNGRPMPPDSPWYTEFLARQLFYFQTREVSAFSAETRSGLVTIAPMNYDIRRVCACMHRAQFKQRDAEVRMDFRMDAGETGTGQATLGRLAGCPL